jgi:predicted small lipoprotein YifL
MKRFLSLLALLSLLLSLAACGNDPKPTEPSPSTDATVPSADASFAQTDDTMFTEQDFRTEVYEGRVVNVTLSGDTATADSNAVQIKGSTIQITEEATYIFTGSYNGMIVVNCEKSARPQLILKDAAIHSETSAALYVMQADRVTVTLADGTENYLSNGGAFEAIDSESIDAALYSRRDLVINGGGKLTVLSPAGKGISSKDHLILTGGVLDIQSASHGIDANDSLRVTGISATVAAGMDGIHCENNTDTDFGYIYISSGSFHLTAAGDGIAAGAWLQVKDGSFTLLTGGGHENGEEHTSDGWGGFPGAPGGHSTTTDTTDSTSMKGIKAATGMLLSGGSYTIDSADDALHCDASLTVENGSYTIATGDDALHAEETLSILAGTVDISTSYEGLEALHIVVAGGDIKLVASDDGLNAAGGNDQSGTGGRDEMFGGAPGGPGGPGGHGGMGGMSAGNGSVTISDGTLYIRSSGDGIDANGTITISGGHTTIVGPTQGDTATLDYDRSCVITGGTFIGTGARGMAQSFSASKQGVIALQMGNQAAGTKITLTDAKGTTLIDYAPELGFAVVILSCPEMVSGENYTVTVGTASGTFAAN